jgi:hypothetical protein
VFSTASLDSERSREQDRLVAAAARLSCVLGRLSIVGPGNRKQLVVLVFATQDSDVEHILGSVAITGRWSRTVFPDTALDTQKVVVFPQIQSVVVEQRNGLLGLSRWTRHSIDRVLGSRRLHITSYG